MSEVLEFNLLRLLTIELDENDMTALDVAEFESNREIFYNRDQRKIEGGWKVCYFFQAGRSKESGLSSFLEVNLLFLNLFILFYFSSTLSFLLSGFGSGSRVFGERGKGVVVHVNIRRRFCWRKPGVEISTTAFS